MRIAITRLLAIVPILASIGRSQEPSTIAMAVQANTGMGFDDHAFGFNTVSRRMSFGGLTMFRTRTHGDDAMLLFLLTGQFADADRVPTGERTRMVAEWTSTFDLARSASGQSRLFLSGQLFRDGQGFRANLVGIGGERLFANGTEFRATSFGRHIEQGAADFRERMELTIPWKCANVRFSFNGYEDVTARRGRAVELSGLWQLLVPAEDLFSRGPKRMKVGVKWFNHHGRDGFTSATSLSIRLAL